MTPLETLTVGVEEEGTTRTVPALSCYFVSFRSPIQFTAPPQKSRHGQYILGTKEDWLCKMVIYRTNIEWLLSLPHHRFWSQVVYGNDTWDSVISFLQEGFPFYSIDNLPDDEDIQEIYYIIMNLVFKVFARVSTQRESKDHWIGDKKYGSLLYNYTILSVPIFLDLCAIFGVYNADEVRRIITNSFEAQPLYKEDFNVSIQHIKAVFQSIEEQFSTKTSGGQMCKISERKLTAKEMTVSHVQDLVLYALDITVTMSTFVDFYVEAALILHSHRFEINVASFYDNVITDLSRRIQNSCDKEGNMDTYFTLMFKLNQTRYYLIKLYHQCIHNTLNNLTRSDRGDIVSKDVADNYLEIITECLQYKLFMQDYQTKWPIEDTLQLIRKKCPDLDNVKYNFLLEGLFTCIQAGSKSKDLKPNGCVSSSIVPNNQVSSSSKVEVQGVELESLVTEVKDLLPDLGDGFVKECLKYYNYSSSSVINAILENNLPDCLSSLSRTLSSSQILNSVPEDRPPTFSQQLPQIQKNNVFNDFDIASEHHVDSSKIFKGKRNDPKQNDLKDILDDKTFREELRNRFSLLGVIEDTDNTYDDEYDDTYDGSEFPVPEAGEQQFQKFVIPRVLEQAQKKGNSDDSPEEYEETDEDDDENEGEVGIRKPRKDLFIENPETVRGRLDEQRMRKMKTWQRDHQPRNVTGNPKGQGQGNEVQQNRNKKNVNKSFQSNHNRKRAAHHKRFQGI